MSGLSEAEIAALRWEIGPPTDRDHKWQPMVSAHEVRALLDERDELAVRVASAAAERDQAVAVADSMQHFADVAEVCERKSNEYAAENAALRARLDEVRALHAPDSSGDWCDHCWTGPDAHGNGPGPAWPCATIRALDPVLAAARDEGSEQQGSMAPQANEAAPESDSGADVGGNATRVIRGAQRGDSA